MLHNFFEYLLMLSLFERVLMCVVFCSFLLFLYFYLFRYLRVVTYKGERNSMPQQISIIVVLNGELEFLRYRIKILFEQEYPVSYQVVIVNCNPKQDEVQFELNQLQKQYQNLYITNLEASHRYTAKLAYSLGVKGARYSNVLFLPTSVTVQSRQWLSKMATGFTFNQMVSGVSYLAATPDIKNGVMRVQMVQNQLLFLSSALLGRPFKGDRYNMGFSRYAFLNSGGLSKNLRLNCGEDDLLVQDARFMSGMGVVLDSEAVVRVDSEDTWQGYYTLRCISEFSRKFYPLSTKVLLLVDYMYRLLFWLPALLLLIVAPTEVKLSVLASIAVWFLIMLLVLWLFHKKTKIKIPYALYLLYDIVAPFDAIVVFVFNKLKPNKQVWI